MRRHRAWLGVAGGIALCACVGAAAKRGGIVDGTSGDAQPTIIATSIAPAAAPARPTAPGAALAGPTAPAAAVVGAKRERETGVPFAQHYRDAICACDTKACWSEATAAFHGSAGLAPPKTAEESRTIETAFREASACLQRIDELEARGRAPEPSP